MGVADHLATLPSSRHSAAATDDRPLSGAAVRERIPLMMPSLPTARELLPYLERIDAARW